MNFTQLALVSGVAILGPVLSLLRRLHLPVVVGELSVGLLLGATGFGVLVADDPGFALLAQIGFALVMFVAGSHVPVRSRQVREGLRVGLVRAAAAGVLAVPAGQAIAHVFGTGHGAMYAVLLASSSAALVMPILADVPLSGEPLVSMVAQVAIADAVCIVLLPLAVEPDRAATRAVGAAVVTAAAAAVYAFLRWREVSRRRRSLHELSEHRGLALELRTALTLLFALAALAQLLDVSVMLAGFSLGVVVSAVGEPRRLAKQLFALSEGFFAPMFFVWLGASLDLRQLAANPSVIALGLMLGVVAVALHGVLAATGQPWPASVLTSAQMGVPVAAATLGRAQGLSPRVRMPQCSWARC